MTALSDLSESIERLVRDTSPSVVAVEQGRGQGSGIVIASDGYVVTNAHVVSGSGPVEVRVAPGERTRAERVGEDPATDLAVLRVQARGLPSLPVLESRRLRVGELVLAIGNPLRLERSVSLGVVSAVDRVLPTGRGRALEGLVQTDAAINPGSSGGPLLDATGAVAGVTTAMIPLARGIGFAVPAHTVSWVVPLLLRNGRIARPVLGISARGLDLSQLQALELGQPRAVTVLEVATGEPAERAGLRANDLVVRVNGQPVSGVDDIVRALVFGEGRELELEYLRDGQRRTLRVTPRAEKRAA